MYWTTLLPVFALPAAMAFPGFSRNAKRGYAASDATLYAYGQNISGSPLVYGTQNGLVYVNPQNSTALQSLSVTWNVPTMASSTTTTTDAYLSNGTSVGAMAIQLAGGLKNDIRIASNGSLYGNETQYGLSVYGKQLVYYDGSSIESLFWAKKVDDYYVLAWNSDFTTEADTTPIVIKTIAPASDSTS